MIHYKVLTANSFKTLSDYVDGLKSQGFNVLRYEVRETRHSMKAYKLTILYETKQK
jgi:hypothetical protein